jgi:hypothetical protein
MSELAGEHGGSIGPSTDRLNNPVIDPTENVKALNAAEAKRQDGLRVLESKHMREILILRSKHAQDLRASDTRLSDERFSSIKREQALVEQHRIELKGDSEKALTAALAAAEKAVQEQNKSATLAVDRAVAGMKELIINNQQVNQATTNALGDKVEDLKANVAVLVNTRLGAQEVRTENRAGVNTVGIVIGSAVGLIGIMLGIMTFILSR